MSWRWSTTAASLPAVPSSRRGESVRAEPTTRRRLYVFAHECAHIAIGHDPAVPKHRNEYDAERWAQAALRRHGVADPKKEQERAKKYVAFKVKQAIRRGAKSLLVAGICCTASAVPV